MVDSSYRVPYSHGNQKIQMANYESDSRAESHCPGGPSIYYKSLWLRHKQLSYVWNSAIEVAPRHSIALYGENRNDLCRIVAYPPTAGEIEDRKPASLQAASRDAASHFQDGPSDDGDDPIPDVEELADYGEDAELLAIEDKHSEAESTDSELVTKQATGSRPSALSAEPDSNRSRQKYARASSWVEPCQRNQ